MTMTTTLPQRFPALVSACAVTLALALLGCVTPSCAQTVAVMVNGEPITDFDVDQRTKLDFLSTHKASTRQQVIQELVDEKLKIREAKQYSVDPGSTDIDAAYGQMASRMRSLTASPLSFRNPCTPRITSRASPSSTSAGVNVTSRAAT